MIQVIHLLWSALATRSLSCARLAYTKPSISMVQVSDIPLQIAVQVYYSISARFILYVVICKKKIFLVETRAITSYKGNCGKEEDGDDDDDFEP